VDGVTLLPPYLAPGMRLRRGDVVRARVVGAEGVDLVAAVEAVTHPGPEPDG
jgi:hypothetical protein